MANQPEYPGMPTWVKVFGIVVVVFVLLITLHKVTGIGGHHGPSQHFRSSDTREGGSNERGR